MKLKVDFDEKIPALVIEFAIYSFIGWVYETVLTSAVFGYFVDRGMLHLPLCPIYGFCAIALLLVFRNVKSVPAVFVLGTVLTTAAELAASYVLEWFTDERLWNYADWKFNFQGRIAPGSSLIFGILCVVLIKLLHPMLVHIFDKISGRKIKIAAGIILAVILADLAVVVFS